MAFPDKFENPDWLGKFYVYEGVGAFTDACKGRNMGEEAREAWACGTRSTAYGFCAKGDLSHVAEAERLVDRILADVNTEEYVSRWEPSVVGFLPLVPNYVAGVPEAMLSYEDVLDDKGTVEIWANTTVSCSCKPEDMVRRGVVTLALAMAIDRIRPVRLVIYSTTDKSACAVRLASPIDFSEVCAMFCQPSVTRQLLYGHARQDGWFTYWANWASVKTDDATERKALMKLGGMPENAIHLSTEKLGEYADVSDEELVRILNEKVRHALAS